MKERSFDEMVAYFNRRVSEMDITQDHKMELLGMVTALGYKHEKTVQHWIPCCERLPEKYGNYLITTHGGNVDIGTIDPKKKSVWSACDSDGFYWLREVVAWMPLPAPWKGKKDE